MCRIVGILGSNIEEDALIKMRDTLAYGGPDSAGLYINENKTLGLGHRRLSIIDITNGGSQPMTWKHWTIAFNGEIYNFREIKNQLEKEGYTFETNSDTEVIIKSFDAWSYEAVSKFRGMFAFALWNSETQKLLLCRDRLGVKPLYIYQKNDFFMFASELKAFHTFDHFDRTISQEAVNLYLQTGYIKSPHCIFEYCEKLEPGSFFEIDQSKKTKTWKYWDVQEEYVNAELNTKSEEETISDCEEILTEAFNLRMVADVPVGVFLSGGIDSALVTSLLQKDRSTPLKTYTIGFNNSRINEANEAKEIAKYLGTDHKELYCDVKDFDEVINKLPYYNDEPFADASAIPTWMVSNMASNEVKVCLSADGGDEIFGGYNKYDYSLYAAKKIGAIPKILRNPIAKSAQSKITENLIGKMPVKAKYKENADVRLAKVSGLLQADDYLDFLQINTMILNKHQIGLLHQFQPMEIFSNKLSVKKNQILGAFSVADITSYLEGDILTKVDRASMQNALESREPFLDHKIIEYAFKLSDSYKIRNREKKWILKQILYKYVPKEMMDRPKKGFGIPLHEWISTRLRDQIEEMSSDTNFMQVFQLNQQEVQRHVEKFYSQKNQGPNLLWNLFCLHSWYLKWMK